MLDNNARNSPWKFQVQNKFGSRDIHPQSVDFGRKRAKWCPKIALYLENRKCYGKSDLIFGIYDKFPFTSVSFIFSLLLFFRVKIWRENGQILVPFWMVFWHFLDHYLKYFDETWSEVRQNGQEAVAKDCRSILSTIEEIFWVKDGQNRPKSTKLYEYPNFGRKFFIAFLESMDFNSC